MPILAAPPTNPPPPHPPTGIRQFLEARAPGLEPPELADLSIDTRLLKVTRSIVSKTENWSAADVFDGLQQLT